MNRVGRSAYSMGTPASQRQVRPSDLGKARILVPLSTPGEMIKERNLSCQLRLPNTPKPQGSLARIGVPCSGVAFAAEGDMRGLTARRRRILIVNCFFDELRWPIERKRMIPQAMGPVYLAGVLSRDRCDVRLYSEVPSGRMARFDLLEWADLLVLTGLTNSLDRMRHITAYARTLNPKVVVGRRRTRRQGLSRHHGCPANLRAMEDSLPRTQWRRSRSFRESDAPAAG